MDGGRWINCGLLPQSMRGSFSAGARKLHRAQSAISELVNNLEAQLSVVLFDRSERYPKLTPAGVQQFADAHGLGKYRSAEGARERYFPRPQSGTLLLIE